MPTTAQVPAVKKYLAVMRFKDLTGDATGQLVVDGFAETLTARLAHYPTVQVMRPSASEPRRTITSGAAATSAHPRAHRLDDARRRSYPRDYTVVDPDQARMARPRRGERLEPLRRPGRRRRQRRPQPQPRRKHRPPRPHPRSRSAVTWRPWDTCAAMTAKVARQAIAILEELGASPTVQSALARAYLGQVSDPASRNSRPPRAAPRSGH